MSETAGGRCLWWWNGPHCRRHKPRAWSTWLNVPVNWPNIWRHTTPAMHAVWIVKISRCFFKLLNTHTHTQHTRSTAFFSRTTWVSQHQKGKPFWVLLKQEMIGWQWRQLDYMQIICTTLQRYSHASTPSLIFLRAGCSSSRPTNSVKALKARSQEYCSPGNVHYIAAICHCCSGDT